jgi:hypothetical protein
MQEKTSQQDKGCIQMSRGERKILERSRNKMTTGQQKKTLKIFENAIYD